MTNKEKFMLLVSDRPSGTVERNKERIKNREMLRASQDIALKILNKLDVLNWSKADLAREMNVSPQYISKIVQGKENLTLDTLIKLQNILAIPILATFLEDKLKVLESELMNLEQRILLVEINNSTPVPFHADTKFEYPNIYSLQTETITATTSFKIAI